MSLTIKLCRGPKDEKGSPNVANVGEPIFFTDRHELAIRGDGSLGTNGESYAPGIALDDFDALTEKPDDNTLVYLYLHTGAGVRARAATLANFKTFLGFSEGHVAVNADGDPGYLGDGTDGVIRVGAGIVATVDNSDDYITYGIGFASEARGDIAVRGTTNWGRLELGAAGKVLLAGANDPGWSDTIDGGTFGP
jgi:hypothetical protein